LFLERCSFKNPSRKVKQKRCFTPQNPLFSQHLRYLLLPTYIYTGREVFFVHLDYGPWVQNPSWGGYAEQNGEECLSSYRRRLACILWSYARKYAKECRQDVCGTSLPVFAHYWTAGASLGMLCGALFTDDMDW